MSLKAKVLASRQEFDPRGLKLGLMAEIWATGPRDWIYASRLEVWPPKRGPNILTNAMDVAKRDDS